MSWARSSWTISARRELHLLVAAAAFQQGDFDEAQRLLNVAEKNGSLSDAIAKTKGIAACEKLLEAVSQGSIPAYKAAWEKEQKIRRRRRRPTTCPASSCKPARATSNWSF